MPGIVESLAPESGPREGDLVGVRDGGRIERAAGARREDQATERGPARQRRRPSTDLPGLRLGMGVVLRGRRLGHQ